MIGKVHDQDVKAHRHQASTLALVSLGLCVLVVAAGLAASPALADVPIRRQVTLELYRQGEPYHGTVGYTVHCYGYSYDPGPDPELAPGSYAPAVVYQFHAGCPGFGCKTVLDTYLNYRHIDACDLEVQAQGQQYVVNNFGSWPFGLCKTAGVGTDASEACTLVVDIPDLPAVEAPSVGVGELTAGMRLEVAFLLALLLSWLIEVPVVWLLARYALHLREVGNARLVLTGLLATALTLPYLWLVLPDLLGAGLALWLGEALVFVGEMLLYRWLLPAPWRSAALLSLAANAASLLLGFVLF